MKIDANKFSEFVYVENASEKKQQDNSFFRNFVIRRIIWTQKQLIMSKYDETFWKKYLLFWWHTAS